MALLRPPLDLTGSSGRLQGPLPGGGLMEYSGLLWGRVPGVLKPSTKNSIIMCTGCFQHFLKPPKMSLQGAPGGVSQGELGAY